MVDTEDRFEPPSLIAQLDRARAGDAEAFCEVAQWHEGRLLRQATGLCRDVNLAEDLVSETLVEAWKGLKRFSGTCRFSTWLFAILVHRYQKSRRRARARPVPLALLPVEESNDFQKRLDGLSGSEPSPAEQAAQRELAQRLREAIDVLPGKHREVVLLRFFEDASLPEIAAVTGTSMGTVKSRLHYALEKLRSMQARLNLLSGSEDTPL